MNIFDLRKNAFFNGNNNAFLATGSHRDDAFNRRLLRKKQTGYWFTAVGRVKTGDVMFLILPSDKSDGYPRELYAGIIKKMKNIIDGGKNRTLFTVNEFKKFPSINEKVTGFLNGKFPPTGSTLMSIWSSDLGISKTRDDVILDALSVKNQKFTKLLGGEKESLVKIRMNHDKLRDQCLDYFNSSCCVSGLTLTEALVCSHIKPWSKSNSEEQCDINNVLLLNPSVDRLFDRGLVSFSATGDILLSSKLSSTHVKKLGIYLGMKLKKKFLSQARIEYLKYHRDNIFNKG
jgi:predicted restriction endonuclease